VIPPKPWGEVVAELMIAALVAAAIWVWVA
jgi:hypothetical protein